MEITLTSKKKTQRNLVLIFLASIVIIFIILYFQFFQKKELTIIDIGSESPQAIKKIKIDFGILDNPLFLKLNPFSEPPATPSVAELGRENPFYPYETSSSLEK